MTRGIAFLAGCLWVAAVPPTAAPVVRGLSGDTALARLYDTILNADFDAVPDRLAEACPPAAPEFCRVMVAVAIWWEISLDPESRRHDRRFAAAADLAIVASEAWTTREPRRAESWLALGASYGARAQWRVLRNDRVAAARDGKRIMQALEQSLTLDPALQDAKFGLGMYRYYADTAPVPLRMMRWLLLLPGGDRVDGLRLITDARDRGRIIRGEADFQLHLIYLWYEKRFRDGLDIVRDLQARYPRNPLFFQTEAEILAAYFHDDAGAVAVLESLIESADAHRVNGRIATRAHATRGDPIARAALTLYRTSRTQPKTTPDDDHQRAS